ncbi:hypothetical protein EB796_004580 [Bugula neritina]|uniref:Uncharacterized protein n=1 Tax=Bugula neritina TaxID=10212 RepID=A0A7J7KGU8_BUGNE|nr:hypothetical protein EB796_004580 [Bugula neritina]
MSTELTIPVKQLLEQSNSLTQAATKGSTCCCMTFDLTHGKATWRTRCPGVFMCDHVLCRLKEHIHRNTGNSKFSRQQVTIDSRCKSVLKICKSINFHVYKNIITLSYLPTQLSNNVLSRILTSGST